MSTTPHPARQAQEALFAAYVSATGMEVHLSHSRRYVLQALVERGITPEDVRNVIAALRTKIARGDSGFSDASLLFRNAMHVDAMEERALLLRQQRKPKTRPAAARPQAGETLVPLDDAAAANLPSLTEMAAKAMGRNL